MEPILIDVIRQQTGLSFHVHLPYDPDLVTQIREIPGRRWLPDLRVWEIHFCRITGMPFLQPEKPGRTILVVEKMKAIMKLKVVKLSVTR